MRGRDELWNGISVSDSREVVRDKFPNAFGDELINLGEFDLAGLTFVAQWYHWRAGSPKVKLTHECFDGEALLHARRVRQTLSRELGRGRALIRINGVERKTWQYGSTRVQLFALLNSFGCYLTVEFFRSLYLENNWWAEDKLTDKRFMAK